MNLMMTIGNGVFFRIRVIDIKFNYWKKMKFLLKRKVLNGIAVNRG